MRPVVLLVLELAGIAGFAYAVWATRHYYPAWIAVALALILPSSLLLVIQAYRRNRLRLPPHETDPS